MLLLNNVMCTQECPVTSNGLCDSHGHCAYDEVNKKPYCYCNTGYSGNSCSTKSSSSQTTYDGYSVQLGLLITLLIVALGLTGGVIYLAFRIGEFRKEQKSSFYKPLNDGSVAMNSMNRGRDENVNF